MGEEADLDIDDWISDLYARARKYHSNPHIVATETPTPKKSSTVQDFISLHDYSDDTVEDLESAIDILHDKIREKRGETWPEEK